MDFGRAHFAYHHLVFDTHEIIEANGALSESFFPGPQALQSIPESAKAEFNALFPDQVASGAAFETGALVPTNKEQRRLVHRHCVNQKQIVQKTPKEATIALN